jgi:hypothetical protein
LVQGGDLFAQCVTRAAVVEHVVGRGEDARRATTCVRMIARTSSSERRLRSRTRATCTSSGASTTSTRLTRRR